jgi:acyl phosphate:glycerol-3-phosphate acyltransferase
MSALLVWRHRANIAKLIAGTESRIGEKKAEAGAPAKRDAGAHHVRKH